MRRQGTRFRKPAASTVPAAWTIDRQDTGQTASGQPTADTAGKHRGNDLAQFILIDHSLRSVGGHHYDYAVQILREADVAGYEIVLATHRQFRPPTDLPSTWRAFPLFHYDIYNRYAIACGRSSKRPLPPDLWDARSATRHLVRRPSEWPASVRRLYHRLNRQRRLTRFTAACRQLFRAVELEPNDIVFFATMSAFDLGGLASFLQQAPETARATWHLQSHHDFFDGRPPDYDQQGSVVHAVRRQFRQSLDQISGHRVVFHATTAELAAEYNQLEVGKFCELPYPVNPQFHASPESSTLAPIPAVPPPVPTPAFATSGDSVLDGRRTGQQSLMRPSLNVTCAGGMRREKGSHEMAELIRKLWRPYLASGRVRLRFQATKRRFQRLCRQQHPGPPKGYIEPLVRVPHPLGMNDYVKLIRTSDIGLFLYDSLTYYARCSGILVEMLAAGVPVIVPAGCWLSQQIAEPNFAYLDRLYDGTPSASSLRIADVRKDMPLGAAPIRFGAWSPAVHATLFVPEQAAGLLVRFRYAATAPAGCYVRIRLSQHSQHGHCLDQSACVLGQRHQPDLPVSTFIPVNAEGARIELILQDAYHGGGIEIRDFRCVFVTARDARGRTPPRGATGLIASDLSQIPKLLAEMIEHYDHYRQTAETFSHQWMRQHSPHNTFATLLARNAEASDRATRNRAA